MWTRMPFEAAAANFDAACEHGIDARLNWPRRGRYGGTAEVDAVSLVRDELLPLAEAGLYDTTLAAYRAATGSYAEGKFNALVVLTDGVNEDPGSISRADLLARLERLADPQRPVPLIMIAVGPDADREEANRIAAATGGSGHEVTDPAQIQTVILKAIVNAASPDRRG